MSLWPSYFSLAWQKNWHFLELESWRYANRRASWRQALLVIIGALECLRGHWGHHILVTKCISIHVILLAWQNIDTFWNLSLDAVQIAARHGVLNSWWKFFRGQALLVIIRALECLRGHWGHHILVTKRSHRQKKTVLERISIHVCCLAVLPQIVFVNNRRYLAKNAIYSHLNISKISKTGHTVMVEENGFSF